MDIVSGMGATLAYVGVGVVVLAVGFLVTDLLTPGKLLHHIFQERSVNAAVIAGANLFASGAVVFSAIMTTHDDFGKGIVSTAIFGLLGVVLMAVAHFLIDWLTPGDLGAIEMDATYHPAATFVAVAHVIVGLIVAASIT